MAEAPKRSESWASKLKRLQKLIVDYFKTPELKEGEALPTTIWGLSPFERANGLDLSVYDPERIKQQFKDITENARNEELLAIARADLKLARESNQKNLIILHRTQIVSFAALIVAIFAVVLHL